MRVWIIDNIGRISTIFNSSNQIIGFDVKLNEKHQQIQAESSNSVQN